MAMCFQTFFFPTSSSSIVYSIYKYETQNQYCFSPGIGRLGLFTLTMELHIKVSGSSEVPTLRNGFFSSFHCLRGNLNFPDKWDVVPFHQADGSIVPATQGTPSPACPLRMSD
ncbi:Hypothetical predicted protein [Xyrichtys novacula]|uniref:Uncharacterized protein n=1 Tax=Xyrichtys novacula TaxID=13765 RepID=A0AAV1HCJ7_XYRNO|nr:Hypothetical predicted protein [Xyrichtys novacula]